jgi:hypothetical protein
VSEEERLKTAHALAVEQEDNEALFEIRSRQAEIAAEKVALRTLSQQEAEAVEPDPTPQDTYAPHTRGVPQQEPDEAAEAWQEANPWFNDNTSTQNRIRSAAAMLIHGELLTDGYDPAAAPSGGNQRNDYYMELDRRIAEEFPQAKKAAAQRTVPASPVVGGARAPAAGSKTKTQLTQAEFALTKRLGIDPVQYAREKARKAAEA